MNKPRSISTKMFPSVTSSSFSFSSLSFSLSRFLLMALVGMSFQAHGKSINIIPVSNQLNNSYFNLEDASMGDRPFSGKRTRNRVMTHTAYHWSHQPWILLSPSGDKISDVLVENTNTVELTLDWLMSSEDQLGFSVFGSIVSVAPAYGAQSKAHLGDSRIIYKRRILSTKYWSFAVANELHLPTGVEYLGNTNGASLSNSSFAPASKLIAEYKTNQNQWVFNAGFSYFSEAEIKAKDSSYPAIDGRTRLFLGGGWLTRLSKHWALDTELSLNRTLGKNDFTPPGIFTVGAHYQMSKATSLLFGLGTGSLGSPGGHSPMAFAKWNFPLGASPSKAQRADGSSDEVADNNNGEMNAGDSDPLVAEAYRNRQSRQEEGTLTGQDFERQSDPDSYNPVDEETGKSLFNGDELTKQSTDNEL